MSSREFIRRIVTATNPHWPWSAINRWPYRIAIGATARRMRRLGPVRSLYLRNGLTRADWEPAVSDIDLTLVTAAVPDGEDDYALLGSIWSAYASLKRVFPMLGELDVQTEATVEACSRFGMAGYETRFWQPVFGDGTSGLGFRPGAQRFRLDACNHAQVACLDLLQQRFFDGGGATPLAMREMRRIAAKVLAYAALARGEARTGSVLATDVLTPAGVAAVALQHLDAAARSVDVTWLGVTPPDDPAGAAAGAGAALPFAERPPPGIDAALLGTGVDAIVDANRFRIAILREDLALPQMQASFEGLARTFGADAVTVRVTTPAVFAHWVRYAEPFFYTHLLEHGRVMGGRTVVLPGAPPERSLVYSVLAQAPNMISAARSRDLVAPFGAAFVNGRQFALAVERALFVKTLFAGGRVSPSHGSMMAECERRFGDVLRRAVAIRERAIERPAVAGFEAFLLLRELAQDTASALEKVSAVDSPFGWL